MTLPKLKAHPAANLFPMLPAAELERLADDIEKNGQHDPIIITSDHLVLDGRNRLAACELRGIEPDVQMWDREDDNISPAAWVIGKNVHRRHLTPTQVAMVAARAIDLFRAEAKERQRRGTAPGQEGGTAAAAAAEATGAAERSVARAIAVLKAAPAELVAALDSGAKTLKQAEKMLKHATSLRLADAYVPPRGKFSVVTTDFSWPYRDTLSGSDRVRGGPSYSPMTLTQILAFIRGPLAACCDDVCLLGNWITGPISLDIEIAAPVQVEIQKLGFKPIHERIWEKEEASGADFVGLGHGLRWNAEKLQLYTRGAVILNQLGAAHGRPIQSTVFRAPIGEHSEKPARAYQDLEQLVPYTARLEMFARAERPGWVTTGSELPKKQRRRA